MNLALTYATNRDAVEKVVSSIREQVEGGKELVISIHQVDVGVVADMERLFEEVRREHGGRVVDVLVSNAGYGKRIVDVWYVISFASFFVHGWLWFGDLEW